MPRHDFPTGAGTTRSLAIGSYAARPRAVDDLTIIDAMRREHGLPPVEAMLIGRHPTSWWRRRFGLVEAALVASLLDELGCTRPCARDERRILRAVRRADLSLVIVADAELRRSVLRVRTGARRWLHVDVGRPAPGTAAPGPAAPSEAAARG